MSQQRQKNRIAIIYFDSGDWEAIYVDGKLEYEGYNIPSSVLLGIMIKYRAFDDEYDSYWIGDVNGNNYLDISLPDKLEEIPKEWLI